MSLLGQMWHSIGPVTISPVTGGAAIGTAYASYQHSLLTTPDVSLVQMRSILTSALGGSQNTGLAGPFVHPGNASQVTVAVNAASLASFPTVCADVYVAYIFSAAR